jgi:hypothetical protein
MFQFDPRKAHYLLYLLIPLLFFKPVWRFVETINSTLWLKVGQFISSLRGNVMTSILIFVVVYLVATRR